MGQSAEDTHELVECVMADIKNLLGLLLDGLSPSHPNYPNFHTN